MCEAAAGSEKGRTASLASEAMGRGDNIGQYLHLAARVNLENS